MKKPIKYNPEQICDKGCVVVGDCDGSCNK